MKKKILLFVMISFMSVLYAAGPIYSGDKLPSSGNNLTEVPVSFTVPDDRMMAFSTDPEIIYPPGTVNLIINTRTEDGSFYITHEPLYAVWDIASKYNFEIYLYLDGKMIGAETGVEIDWTVAGGNSIVGDGIYYNSSQAISTYSILLADNVTKNHAELTINLDINGLIAAGIPDDAYKGNIIMAYEAK